jgi:hypothetical protein
MMFPTSNLELLLSFVCIPRSFPAQTFTICTATKFEDNNNVSSRKNEFFLIKRKNIFKI